METSAQLTAHPLDAPCSSYCRGDTHAILVLGAKWNEEGAPTTAVALVEGMSPYYREIGWQLVSARRAETSNAHVIALMRGENADRDIVAISEFSTEEMATPQSQTTFDDYEPWLMILRPLLPTHALVMREED